MSFTEDVTVTETGTVVAWHGMLSDIPAGWVLCDGNNGTQDLRNKFIKPPSSYGSGSGDTGGNNTISLSQSQIPSHKHDPVNIKQGGGHNHTMDATEVDASNDTSTESAGGGNTSTSAGSNSHGSGSLDTIGSGSQINQDPKYYEIAFIQRL